MLNDEDKLKDYSITYGSVINVVERRRGSIRVYARTIDGRSTSIEIDPTETVLNLKKKIEEKNTLASDHVLKNLVYKSTILYDDKMVTDYRITHGSVINVIARLRGGISIFAKTICGRSTLIETYSTETVFNLKKKIEEKFDIDPECQKLLFNGKMLNDEDKLKDYSITYGSVINVVERQRCTGITIYVQLSDGKVISVEIDPTDIVLSLKKIIERKLFVHHDEMDIIFNGISLEDKRTLEYYSITNFSTIEAITPLSGCGKAVSVQASDGNRATLPFDEKETVLDLKKKIAEKFSITPNLQVLNFQGVILDDDEKNLSCYPFSCKTVIDLTAHISIRTSDGGTFKLEMVGTRTVCDLKKRIATKLSLTIEELNLVFEDIVLEDDIMIDQLNILKDSVISVHIKKRIYFEKDGEKIFLLVRMEEKVSDIKRKIREKAESSSDDIQLCYKAGRRLRDDKTLLDYGIEDTSEIRVLFLW